MSIWLYPLLAACLGALLTIQPLMNGVLTRAVGNPLAATTVSGLVTFLSALALLAVSGRPGDFLRGLAAFQAPVPWWVYLAGMIGTAFVFGAILIAPVIGAAAFFVCVVAGQLIGATLADHIGLLGLEQQPVSLTRIAGLLLVLIGCVIVQRA
ncbi:DMT family transporter [Amaricoccus solimangrovi]|nr:DMT family transporter [Amaricoccus solimangrovi]